MIGTRISHFRILEKIGAGGMGEVYKAEDVDLGREVAIKVLPPHLMDDEDRRERFITEARTAAAVTHPNIATIHEIGEDNGRTFIAMELVEGRTLRSLIRKQSLGLKEAVRIGTEIASGLAAAHKARIAHRDLKPDNILLTSEGHVKILDFGLARLLDAQGNVAETAEPSSDTSSTDADETQAMTVASESGDGKGKVLGTPAYMSPEQARGQDLDYRTDLFSFGCTFYEMLTGRPPFKGSNSTETLQEVLNKEPLPAAHLNNELPSSVQWVLDKCLEKDPNNRYQDTRDLVVDLRHIHPGTSPQPVGTESAWNTSGSNTDNLTNPFTGSVSTSVSSSELQPARNTGDRAKLVLGGFVAIVVLLTVLSIAVFRNSSQQDEPVAAPAAPAPPPVQENSLAVFAFNNLQNPDDDERLGQIMQELLITDLSGLDPLRVFSSQRLHDLERQVSFQGTDASFGETDKAQDVAELAGAQTMLTGTLSQLGERWILTANLTEVATGNVLTAKRFDGTDLYAMVDELTQAIQADFALGQTGEVASRSIRDKTSTSMEAWNYYLTGIEYLDRQEFGEAVVELTRAIESDPMFGQAYYQLGIATWWKHGDAGSGTEHFQYLLDERLYASEKERRMAKGMMLVVENKWSEAIPVLTRLARDYADEKYAWYALGEAQFHFPGNAHTDASAQSFEKAVALDPDFLLPYRHILDVLRMNNDFAGALQRANRQLRRRPESTFWLRQRVTSLAWMGDREGTLAALDDALAKTTDPVDQRELYVAVFEAAGSLGFLDWAEEMVAKARAVDPNNDIKVRNAYISTLWQRWKLDDVEQQLTQWAEEEPSNNSVRERLLDLHVTKGDFKVAHRLALEMVESQTEDPRWYRYWARYAVYKGNATEIDRAMNLALEHNESQDDRRNLYTNIAWAYRNVGNTNRAIEYAQMAMDVEPEKEFPNLWTSMARFELERGRFDEAEAWYRRALAMNPESEDMLFSLARVSIARGETDVALQHIRGGVDMMPDIDTKHYLPLSTMILNNDLEEAEELTDALADVQVGEPQKWAAMFDDLGSFPPGLVWSYLLRGEQQKAEELLDMGESMDMHRRRDDIYHTRGWIAFMNNDVRGARQQFEAGLKVGYRHQGLQYSMAAIEYMQGNFDRSEEWLDKADDDGIRHISTTRFRSRIAAARGNWNQARAIAETAVAMDSTRTSMELLSWVLVEGDLDLDGGISMAQQARKMTKKYTDIERNLPYRENAEHTLGLAYLKKGAHMQAVEHLQKATTEQPNRSKLKRQLERALELTADTE